MLNALGRSRHERQRAADLFDGLVLRARAPVFFTQLAVPDTIDGRFDLLTFHVWLALERLKDAGENDLAQALVNRLFVSFDESLRELGVGDIGIGHRVKKMADAVYGRFDAYGAAISQDLLAAAIMRNVYRSDGAVTEAALSLAHYAISARNHLAKQPAAATLDFGPLPGEPR